MSLTINELILRLNDIFGDEASPITKIDITQPTTDFVQIIFFNFLQEFGFSPHMLQTNHSCLDLHAGVVGNLSSDIADTLSRDILVIVTQSFFQRIGYRDYNFGILDLVEPNQKVNKKENHLT